MKTISLGYLIFFVFFINTIIAQNFEWVRAIGRTGSYGSGGFSIATDMNGNTYTTGQFSGTIDFDPSTGIANLISTSDWDYDIFITKFDANGNFIWARQFGNGVDNDNGKSIVVDAVGNSYTTGFFYGTIDFDPEAGVYNLTSTGQKDVFILKLDANGNFIWAKQIETITGNDEEAWAIFLDETGHLYTTGYFSGTADFDPNVGIANLSSIGGYNEVFICKLDTAGNFVWVKNMGGASVVSYGNAIIVDANGFVYTTGFFEGTCDFNPGAGIANLSSLGGLYKGDVFVSKLDSNGNFVWAKQFSGSSLEEGVAIAVDDFGNVYTAGWFGGTVDFDPNMNTINLNSASGSTFVSKLDINGNYVWAKQLGGQSRSMVLDAMNNIYTVGSFAGTADFDPNAGVFNLTAQVNESSFISKLDSSGNFVWAKHFVGGGTYNVIYSIVLDLAENIYTTGSFAGLTDFDPNVGVYNTPSLGGDIFIHKMNNLPVPITKIENNLTCTLYPNPTNGILHLEIAQDFYTANIEIINTLGQILAQTQTNDRNSQLVLPNETGIYFIRVEVKGKVGIYKIVRE